ncbi:MAG: hypothetical protein QOF98_3826, partial [Streptomyces sp.]|nr:hypothetical protein [Streptomyces sp.]
ISKDNATLKIAQSEHSGIVSAVVDGDPDRAAELMRDHLTASLQLIRSALTE